MCGFVAIVGRQGFQPEARRIETMCASIRHRGPDDSGLYISGTVGLGFRRLSILDLSPAGHQPMTSPDGKVTIVFNGEIYNFIELRQELESLGYRFRSSGDTEVLLHAYLQWGTGCLEHLNGMWAFLILDERRGVVFGSRDRFGMKPLFIWRSADIVLLASEIKAIRASGLYQDSLNNPICAEFLIEGRLDESRETFFIGIEQIPAAHAFELHLDGRYHEWCYWSLETCQELPSKDIATQFAQLFEEAVFLHMRSDVPVGVHLSGGLDSTSIACASARIRSEQGATDPLWAFCYADSRFDESAYVAETVHQTEAQILTLETNPVSLWEDLPNVLRFQDEPVHSITAVVGYQLMGLTARSGVKVILNGQGADETIGGYPSYFRDYWFSLLQNGQLTEAWREVSAYATNHDKDSMRLIMDLIRHFVQTQAQKSAFYRRVAAQRRRDRAIAESWTSPDLAQSMPLRNQRLAADLCSVLNRSISRTPLPLYLRVEDRNAMAHSVEARLPFLDYRLISFVLTLPSGWHLRGPWNKYVLREAMRDRIPESIRSRLDKMGFPTAMDDWLRKELYKPVREIVTDPEFQRDEFISSIEVENGLERHRRQEAKLAGKIFSTVQFFLWRRNLKMDSYSC